MRDDFDWGETEAPRRSFAQDHGPIPVSRAGSETIPPVPATGTPWGNTFWFGFLRMHLAGEESAAPEPRAEK